MTRPSPTRSDLPPYTGTLTPEHLAVIRAERDRWLRIGLSTECVDRAAAETAVRRAYAAAGFRQPSLVVWMDSPLGGCLATATLRHPRGQLKRHLDDQAWSRLLDQLDDQLRSRLLDQLQGQLEGPLEDQLRDQLRSWLADPLWGRLDDELEGRLGSQLRRQLRRQLFRQLRRQLRGRLEDQLRGQLWRQLHDHLRGWLQGQFDQWSEPFRLAKWRCALQVAGLGPSPWLEALADAVARLGCWWPLRGAVVLTDRPTIIARDDQGRLHAATGPALAWADGYTLHAIHGVLVPAQAVEAPETITVGQIRDEENVEVRRVLLDRYGHVRFLRDADAEQVHTDDTGTLWRCPLPGDEPLVMVQVTNATPEPDGSARAYWLRVPPGMRTARQAVAWTFGLDEGEYTPTGQT